MVFQEYLQEKEHIQTERQINLIFKQFSKLLKSVQMKNSLEVQIIF